jgi:hypothetical protein
MALSIKFKDEPPRARCIRAVRLMLAANFGVVLRQQKPAFGVGAL